MKLWIDACLSPTLEDVAYERGYEATSNRRRDMLSELDPNLYPTVVAEDWTFVTNNEGDFRELAELEQLHPGLIFLPQSMREVQQQWFDRVLAYIEEHADEEDEPPGDWMVMRLVVYHEDDTITHAWLPQQE